MPLILAQTLIHGLLIGLGVSVVVAGVFVYILRRQNKGIARIKYTAQQLAGGRLEQRVAVGGQGELSGLAEALNRMAGQLRERLGTLSNQRNELEAVLASMAEGVLAVDTDEHLLSLNPSAAALLDVDPTKVMGRSIQEVVRNPALQGFVSKSLATQTPQQAEIVLRAAASDSGEKPADRCLLAQSTTLRDAHGLAIGGLVVLLDVTQLRRLESVRRDFVTNVSHEIKTPVAAIKAAAETILDSGLNADANTQRFLRIIVRQADRLHALVDDILNLARIEQDAEKQRVVLEPAPLAEVISASVEACQAKADQKNIRIVTDCSESLLALMHPEMLERAVLNLLDNAVKYSPENSLIRVRGEQVGPEVVLSVQDQGAGIAPEDLTRVFERFYRVDKARSRAMGGTGLGLAIVKHVAQAHGGRVNVQSTLGQGSTFTLHLRGIDPIPPGAVA